MISAQGEAERIKVEGRAHVDVYREWAMAEAEEMKAKGYTYQDETHRKVSLEAMQNGLPGTGSNGGAIGEAIGVGVTLGAVSGMMNMTKSMVDPVVHQVTGASLDAWNCSCGQQNITSKFCPECGKSR